MQPRPLTSEPPAGPVPTGVVAVCDRRGGSVGPSPVPGYSPGGGGCQGTLGVPVWPGGGGMWVPGGTAGVPHRVRGPPWGAGWGAPPLLPSPAAFALGRGAQHRLPSPSRDSWRVPGCRWRRGAAWSPLGRAPGGSVWWREGTRELLPALPGRRLRRAPGTRQHRQEQVWPAGGSA